MASVFLQMGEDGADTDMQVFMQEMLGGDRSQIYFHKTHNSTHGIGGSLLCTKYSLKIIS